MGCCQLLLIVHFVVHAFAGNSWQNADTSISLSANAGFPGHLQVAPIKVTNGTIGSTIKGHINSINILLFNYEYTATGNDVLVVSINCNVTDLNEPLLISTWTQWDALSWRLPWRMDIAKESVMFHEVNRTMCPREVVTPPKFEAKKNISDSLMVMLSTRYPGSNLSFALTVDWRGSFVLRSGTDLFIVASPVSPAFVRVIPPKNGDPFVIRATSADDICMTVAIRSLMCEAFNEFSSPKLQYDGFWQSATTQSSVTVDPLRFPNGILLEIFIEADDSLCKSSSASKDKIRNKHIQLTVLTLPTSKDLAVSFVIPSVLLLTIGLLTLLTVYIRIRWASRAERPYESLRPETGGQTEDDRTEIASTSAGPLIRASDLWQSILTQRESRPSLADVDRAFKDKVPTEPATYRQTLLLAAFSHLVAALPLAITGLHEFNITGNQDTCAFNFRCAVPWGPIPDINHVFSNLGYIVFGFALLVGTYMESEHWTKLQSSDTEVTGIAPQFGLFWCLAVNMVAAGILGGAYHLCPSELSYELDMSFLYALVLHMMLSLYRRRHPNFGVSLPSMWKTWAVIEAAALAGLHTEGVWEGDTFWTFWTTLHIGLAVFLSVHMYYAGIVNLNKEDVVRLLRWQLSRDHTNGRLLFPMRFFVLVLGLAMNMVFAFYGAIVQPPDVPAYVLLLLVANLLFYTVFYVLMKMTNGERLTAMTWSFMLVAILTWILAIILFCQPSIAWESTPAQSRAANSDCSYLGFYDSHDLWHFLSSAALFFMSLAFINLDSDLRMVPYEKINVF